MDVTPADGARGIDARDGFIVIDMSGNERGAAIDGVAGNIGGIDSGKNDLARDTLKSDTTAKKDGNGLADVAVTEDAPDDSSAPPLPNSCANPLEIPTKTLHFDIDLDTTDETHKIDLPCATNGNDFILSFYITEPQLVYADTFGSAPNTVLALSKSCPLKISDAADHEVTCNDDACGVGQSQVYAVMPYGRHYLVVSTLEGEEGPITVHFQHSPVGGGKVAYLESGTGTLTGTTSGGSRTADCEAAGPEDSYWWAGCPDYAGGTLEASTCGGATWDVVLSVHIPAQDILGCGNGDTCGQQEEISLDIPAGAGIGVLTIDGDLLRSAGDYSMTYTLP